LLYDTFCSISAQGIQESTTMIIDNMKFSIFTTAKVGVLFNCQ
jgi:hypothetical protein